MKTYKVVLSIAGSDSGGGAGIQADIKTISALGCYAATVITAITAQNTLGVKAVLPIDAQMVEQQLEAVLEDMPVKVIKIGMINTAELVPIIAKAVKKYEIKQVVLDPVMVATSGDKLIQKDTIALMQKELFPLTSLITPNLDEAEILTQTKIKTVEQMKIAAQQLCKQQCNAALIKGGHLVEKTMTDVLFVADHKEPSLFSHPKIMTNNTHGTGCSLSSAIASFLAQDFPLQQAVELATKYIFEAIEEGKEVRLGHGRAGINHFFSPKKLIKD